MTTYAEASTPKTVPALRAQALALLAAGGAPVAGWSERAPQRLAVDDFAARMAEETEIRALLAASISPQTAASAGRDWTIAAIGWFAETLIPALPAVWNVRLTVQVSEAPLTIAPGTVLQLQTGSGIILELLSSESATLSASSSPTPYQAALRFQARAAGTVGNTLGAGVKIITGPAGLTASSPALFTAGRDEELPAAAVTRCLGKWSRLGAGWTAQAFDYLIPLAAPTVTRWRVRDDNPFGPGTVGLTLANAAGPATDPEVAAVQALVAARSVRPLGSGPVTAAKATLDALALSATVLGDGTNANLQADIEAALAALGGPYAIGPAVLSVDIVRAVILGAAFTSIDVDDGGGNLTTLAVNIPGFTGCAAIISCSLAADHPIADGDVLVLTPAATVT